MKQIKNSIISWIVFSSTVLLCYIGFAAYNWLPTKNTGETVAATEWNAVINKLNDSAPTWMVAAFFWSACPSGWILADGTWDEPKTDGSLGTLDLRWEFIRWLDSSRWIDIGRTIGSYQNGSLVVSETVNNAGIGMITRQDSATYTDAWPAVSVSVWWTSWTASSYTNPYIRTVRPRNVALLYCVKQ